MHEGSVGAVLQQPSDEIRQQVLMGAYGCIGAHGREVWNILANGLEEHFAHPMEALEFVTRIRGRKLQHRRYGKRVVSRELWINELTGCKQPLHTDEITRIRSRLGGVHRKTGETSFLGAFDFAVPVGTFDEAYRHAPTRVPCKLRDPIDDERRTA